MRRAVSDKLSILNDGALALMVMQDIDALQISPTEELFDAAAKLFLVKWRENKNANMSAAIAYFEKEWLIAHKGWFISFIDGPATTNGLESTNGVIKKENTLRKRLNLATFLKAAFKLVQDWSTERNPKSLNHRKPLTTQVTIETRHYTKSYQWLKNPSRSTIQSENTFFSRAEGAESFGPLTNKDIKVYKAAYEKKQFKTFDEFYNICFSIWCTKLNRDDFRKSTCTCPSYFKHYICKHIIGIAAIEKLIKIPCQAKSLPIGAKPKPGRPPAAKKALQLQDPPSISDIHPTTFASASSAPLVVTVVQKRSYLLK